MLTIVNSSDYILDKINENKQKNQILIVPELFSHNYERILCEICSNEISKTTEVLSFKRICNRIFCEIGGLATNYINDSGRVLAMYNAINAVYCDLKVYKNNKIDVIDKILNIIDEFKIYKISENDILKASENIDGNLKNKLIDLYYIYTEYNKITSNDIRDPRDEFDYLCENMHKSNIYNEYDIYFNEFDGFTPQQYVFLNELLKKDINVIICLNMKEKQNKIVNVNIVYENTKDSLIKLCKRNNYQYKLTLQ